VVGQENGSPEASITQEKEARLRMDIEGVGVRIKGTGTLGHEGGEGNRD
jgi:hypothetical protein